MTTPCVLVSDPLPEEAIELLAAGGRIEVIQQRAEYDDLLARIDAWIVRSGTRVTAQLIERCPRLRYICRAGAGVDNVDRAAAASREIGVMNTPGANSRAAAELTVALLLALARRIPFAHLRMAKGGWDRAEFTGIEVRGKRLGIVGLGRVGREVARMARGLDMEVAGYDPMVDAAQAAEYGVEHLPLDDLLPRCDFIALHTPRTPETEGLFDEARFATLRDGVRIVNCSRGGIVVESALLAALERGKVAGAALDVFDAEPPPTDSPLRGHPGIILTPHLGASTVEAQRKVGVQAAEQVRDALLEGRVVNALPPPSPA